MDKLIKLYIDELAKATHEKLLFFTDNQTLKESLQNLETENKDLKERVEILEEENKTYKDLQEKELRDFKEEIRKEELNDL